MGFTAEDAVTFIRYTESGILGFMAYLFLTDATVGQNAVARYVGLVGGDTRDGLPLGDGRQCRIPLLAL